MCGPLARASIFGVSAMPPLYLRGEWPVDGETGVDNYFYYVYILYYFVLFL